MFRWAIIIALLAASCAGMIAANRFVNRRSKAGIFYWHGMTPL